MQGGDTALESQKENALNTYEGFRAKENESLTESYQRLISFVNDLRRRGVEKSRYEVNVKFLKNLTHEWQNMAINIQLSRNLGTLGLHDLYSMMVQHEEFITGGRSKRAVDPLALAAVPLGGPNSAPNHPTSFNQMTVSQHPEDFNHVFNQEFHQNFNQGIQHPDDPMIITISDEELFHMNESLALIFHNMQKLLPIRDIPDFKLRDFKVETEWAREEVVINIQEDFNQVTKLEENISKRDNWRCQNPDNNFRGNSRQQGYDSGYSRQGYEGSSRSRFVGGRNDHGSEFGYEQGRNDRWSNGRIEHGKGSYNGDFGGNGTEKYEKMRKSMEIGQSQLREHFTTAPTVPTNPITKPDLGKDIPGKLLHMIKDLTFDGKNDSNPIVHMENFVDICDLFKTEEGRDDAIRLRVFPLTLTGEAKSWLRSLEPSSITTWEGLRSKFLSRFFPPSKIDKPRAEIRSFRQHDGETVSESWERFKHLLNSCPSHGLSKSEQVQTFYSGLGYSSRAILDSSAGGVFMYKTPTEGYKLHEDMLIHNIDWRTDKRLQIPRMAGKISTDFDPSDELATMKNQ
ncbi:hypothetical protein OSB04_020056 [Centaurea solstitialis]|uniref:Retrotransposon gag domain-containing protein n=1 Tax=Centaurea solstitialis TaxID=347529 RepID=A0AA38SRZ9_9ASTR|nr:hypothetical protein OSB04_020056 [Centaurea solstitialis]